MGRKNVRRWANAALLAIAAPLLTACLVSDDDLYRAAPVSVQIDDGRYEVQTRQGGAFKFRDWVTIQSRDNVAGVAREENGDFYVIVLHDIGDGWYMAANEVRGRGFRYMVMRPAEGAILGWSLECDLIQELGLHERYDIEADFFDCRVSDRETLQAAALDFAERRDPDFRIILKAQ